MISRAQRLRGRHGDRPGRSWRAPVVGGGATDEFAGLGRVEQLVLRGDGLTTTSLEILTGQRVEVEVVGHRVVAIPGDGDGASLLTADVGEADIAGPVVAACTWLDAGADDLVLSREVLLVGADRTVFGTAEVIALTVELPPGVVRALATTDQPIGRLLREHDVPVVRELHRWGLFPAGAQADRLGPGLGPSSRVPGREYLMRNADTARAFALLVERLAPSVFAPARPAAAHLRRVP